MLLTFRFIDPCITLIRKKCKELSPTSDTCLVNSLMQLMDCQMDEFHDEAKMSQMEDREKCSWIEVDNLQHPIFICTKVNKLSHKLNSPQIA